MPNRGTLVVLLLLIAGLMASAAAIWHHRHKTQQALELWGSEGSLLIERAPDVTLYRLVNVDIKVDVGDKATPDAEMIRLSGEEYVLTQPQDMQGAAGFSHVRWGLCQDSSYAWQSDRAPCDDASWNFAVRFVDGPRQLTIAFDTNGALVTAVGAERCISYQPITKEVETVLKRQLPDVVE